MSQILVEHGPSKLELMLALFHKHDLQTVTLKLLANGFLGEVDFFVDKVAKCNPDNDWIVEFSCSAIKLRGTYNTNSRKGLFDYII